MEKSKKDYSQIKKEIIIAFVVFLIFILVFGDAIYDLFWKTMTSLVY